MLATLEGMRAAAARIEGVARRTPVLDLAPLVPLQVKCEQMQPIGAFKIRGAFNYLARMTAEQRARGVITYSSGNHGQAVAFAAHRFGVPAVIVMPETAPLVKVEGARRWGAEVLFAGTTTLHRQARAEALAGERGLVVVPPFDCLPIVEGQGTTGLEIVEQVPDVRTVVVPVGGGGLISGVAAAIKLTDPSIRVIGVEPAGAPKMSQSLAAGMPVTLSSVKSIADGLMAVRPGVLNFLHVQAFVDEVITVSDEEIVGAARLLWDTARLAIEPSGATSVAGALPRLADWAREGPVVAVLSGGNVSLAALADLLA
ncbi:threonine/serine dehydratase [Luteitalea sp.]|uniref:threonine/serine dehydratase n=1 Tax=Luteitalea sp. TaxID=2004800 RepID=UPI0025BA8E96|nr:threonine/serine dehydratase [Luteitalea sp.]